MLLSLLCAVLIASVLAGCAGKSANNDVDGGSAASADATSPANIGDFRTVDLDGNEIGRDDLKDSALTMVNIWATWCSPCIAEIPDIAELAEELKDDGFRVVGIVTDALNEDSDEPDAEMTELARTIAEESNAAYPMLIPDDVLQQGILKDIMTYPTTFFADSEGNFVGKPYMGKRSKEEWKRIIEETLEQVEG
jgi:thiol-disulfide isomerase/thioredoxin